MIKFSSSTNHLICSTKSLNIPIFKFNSEDKIYERLTEISHKVSNISNLWVGDGAFFGLTACSSKKIISWTIQPTTDSENKRSVKVEDLQEEATVSETYCISKDGLKIIYADQERY